MATPNIAFVKYWGKRNDKLILPYNSSISITLGEELNTKTSVMFTKKIKEDIFYINGQKQDLTDKDVKERFAIIDIMRKKARTDAKVIVVSENSFPTAAGLASSASGIAAMVYAVNAALKLNLDTKELSIIARQGSGSSCRSLTGGFVKWEKGNKEDGSDSYIRQIKDSNYWPDLINIITIVSKSKKKISSRVGMKQTVETSQFYKLRPNIAEEHCNQLEEAISRKDFEQLCKITMQESNNFHSVALDTYPPIIYLNDTSKEIINAIHELNESEGKIIAAYTFDAGPNANIITLDKYKNKVLDVLKKIDDIEQTIITKSGNGPILDESKSLITPKILEEIGLKR
ncbi:MAG: diphosphomevalonate decarboxylase [Candidatus Marsarchaeota archaeon]|nr:diphosphomevalonate decarboxylase [Candidatus Marsarchaeota archaeon]